MRSFSLLHVGEVFPPNTFPREGAAKLAKRATVADTGSNQHRR